MVVEAINHRGRGSRSTGTRTTRATIMAIIAALAFIVNFLRTNSEFRQRFRGQAYRAERAQP
jgi:hypothetical protein